MSNNKKDVLPSFRIELMKINQKEKSRRPIQILSKAPLDSLNLNIPF